MFFSDKAKANFFPPLLLFEIFHQLPKSHSLNPSSKEQDELQYGKIWPNYFQNNKILPLIIQGSS